MTEPASNPYITEESQGRHEVPIEEALDRAADLYDYNSAMGGDDPTRDVAEDLLATLSRQFEGVATESEIDSAVDRYIEGPPRAKTSGLVDSLADARRAMSSASRYAHDEPDRAQRILSAGHQEASTTIDAVVRSVGSAVVSEDLDLTQSRAQNSAATSTEQAEQASTDTARTPGALDYEDDLSDEETRLRSASFYEARWVQETAQVHANLQHGHTDEVTQLLHEIDENLRNFDRGGYPPDSDEMDGIYIDAVTRAAIPYGQQPVSVEEVARQLRNVGYDVPTLDLDTIAQRTGVTPLERDFVTNKIDGGFQATWDQHVGNDYSLPVSRSAIHDYGYGPSLAVSIGEVGSGETVVHVSLDRDGAVSLQDDETSPLDVAEISQASGLSTDEVTAITTGAAAALRTTVAPDPALADLASARLDVRRAIASITEDSEAAQTHLLAANKTLTQVVETLRPDALPDVQAAQESVQQASERVEAVAEAAKNVDPEVTLYTKSDCPGCFATKRTLDKAGVEYDEINLEEHPELLAQFKRQGKMQAPIVQTKDGDVWTGYNPSKLKEHGLDHRTRQQRQSGTGTDQGHGR